ncbi:LPS assembly lipoprotein LptE [Marinomonas sp. THO17]|uniref:LPS-assembly lipoprotein LptE n=1 Tax=Marinomonas sp. THO17 TaxID=3149048 RepID=UPI00336BF80D
MTIHLPKTARLVLFALLSLSLLACGFHLKGTVQIPQRLKMMTLTSQSGSAEFDRALRLTLSKAGVVIVDKANASADTLELKVNGLSSSDTVLARNNSNDVSQVERRLSGVYFVRQADGKSLYGPRNISTNKTLVNQDAEESAKLSYNQTQMQSMYEDLAKQLLYDLGYVPL